MLTANNQSLTSFSARELAGKISKGAVSALEVVEAHIEQIEKVNPKLNAVVFKRYGKAREEARRADALRAKGGALPPLHGVPVTVKEVLDLEGSPSTFGLPSRGQAIQKKDDPYVSRLREAGAIILGKTNVSQNLIFLESDNPLFGRTNNPWNLDRSPGGSSGGEAAIIAAGGSPLGLGTDIGGSIRVPSTFCGLAGMKPTAGRCPDFGRLSMPIGEQAIVSQVGVMARRVCDVEMGLEIINGGVNPAVEPPMPLGNPASVDISRLRVAFYTDDGTFRVAPAVSRAVKEAAGVLKSSGAQVVEWSPPDVRRAVGFFYQILTADGGEGLKNSLGKDKRDPRVAQLLKAGSSPRLIMSVLSGLLNLGGQKSQAQLLGNFGYRTTHHYWTLVEELLDFREAFKTALDKAEGGPFDLILCPACALPALTHGSSKDLGVLGGYTVLYNVLGYPTGIVPVTRVRGEEQVGRQPSRDKVEQVAYGVEKESAGLPVGVQVVARPWREHLALAAMQTIEKSLSGNPDFPTLPPL